MFNICIVQISIWTWPNALYNSRGNQINIAQITILQVLFINQIKCWFLMRGENRSTWEKTSHDRVGPTNSIHIWHRVRKSNPGHIGGRQVLSPLGQPCHTDCHVVWCHNWYRVPSNSCSTCKWTRKRKQTSKAAQASEVPKICPQVTNISSKKHEQAPKISDYDYLMGLRTTSSSEFGPKLW